MSFKDWLFSNRPKDFILESQPWGVLHIVVLLLTVAFIVTISILLRKKDKKIKFNILFSMAMMILFFELTRRGINLCRKEYINSTGDLDWRSLAAIILPRPWCAISCWMIISSVFVDKKFFYNFTAITALLNACIFFSYPLAGFKNHIAFEEVYSIGTHILLLTSSVLMITFKFTDFRYNRGSEKFWKELVCLLVVFIYGGLETILKIELDPLYFLPKNDVIQVLQIPYPVYLIMYVVFIFGIWCNSFYLIPLLRKSNDKFVTLSL